MYHYSTVTCHTLPRAEELLRIWQVEFVRLGFGSEFVLSQILAVSAMHLAHMRPGERQRWSTLAAHHQSSAARVLRASLVHATADNCHAAFAASSFMVISAFATPIIHNEAARISFPALEDMLDVFTLIRGMNTVLSSFQDDLHHGSIADFFRTRFYAVSQVFLESVSERLREVSVMLEDHQVAQTIKREILHLTQCIQDSITTGPAAELRLAFSWPIRLTDEYLQLLQRKEPAALVIMAYYCAVLHGAESNAWYIEGWSLKIAYDCQRYLASPWREVAEWPVRYIIMH
jgi:hypothetical protein